jgi:hypothetical protein
MDLRLHFVPKEEAGKRYVLTPDEICQIFALSQGIGAIIKIMAAYTRDSKGDSDMPDNCASVFDMLKILIEPVSDYLAGYAGDVVVEPPVLPENRFDFDGSDRT